MLKERLSDYEIIISDNPQIYGAAVYCMKLYSPVPADEGFDKNFMNDYKKINERNGHYNENSD